MADEVTVDRNLYLTADRTRVVEEGDPEAVWLYAGPGGLIAADEFKRYRIARRKPKES